MMSVDPEALPEMAREVVDQIVDDLNMMTLAGRRWDSLTADERDELAEGWIALVSEQFL